MLSSSSCKQHYHFTHQSTSSQPDTTTRACNARLAAASCAPVFCLLPTCLSNSRQLTPSSCLPLPPPCSDLPGLIDMFVSGIWSIFFLSAGSSLLSWGACKSDSLCLSWNGTIGVCFFLWIVYSVTAVVAALDLRAQIQALKGVPPGVAARECLCVSSVGNGASAVAVGWRSRHCPVAHKTPHWLKQWGCCQAGTCRHR